MEDKILTRYEGPFVGLPAEEKEKIAYLVAIPPSDEIRESMKLCVCIFEPNAYTLGLVSLVNDELMDVLVEDDYSVGAKLGAKTEYFIPLHPNHSYILGSVQFRIPDTDTLTALEEHKSLLTDKGIKIDYSISEDTMGFNRIDGEDQSVPLLQALISNNAYEGNLVVNPQAGLTFEIGGA